MTELRRRLRLGDAVIIGVGSMVGAGVFAVWAPAARVAGNWLLVGLAIAGIVATCNAMSSAQLAARHPESGGTYVYATHRLGPGWGHLAGWGFVVGKTASIAAMATVIGTYISPERAELVASASIVMVMVINIGGLERTVGVTRILLAITGTTLLVVVILGLRGATHTSTPVAESGALTADTTAIGIVRSAGLMFFAFAGYARIATLGEEVVAPEVTIPKAIPRALGVALTVYTVVALTALVALGEHGVAASVAPLADIAATAGTSWGEHLVTVGASVACGGVMLNLVPGVARTVLAMSRRGDMPAVLGRIHPTRALPIRAEFCVAGAAIVVVNTVSLTSSIAVSGVAVLTYYAVTNAAARRLDASERIWPRWITTVGLAGCCLLIVALPQSALIGGVVVIVCGVVARAIAHRR